jgi:UDP-N-acetylglucosamine--N-acetylmuramyl-(pentapeptide) pyrophosphoryl-undecaprenol N-acetylglucosamine transferase
LKVEKLEGSKVENQNLQPSNFQPETLWVGTERGMEADLVNRAGVPFEAIPSAGLHGVGWKALPGNVWQLGRGLIAARSLLRRHHPDVLFFTGGYVAAPVALASRLSYDFARGSSGKKPRILLYVPDIEPGLALKALVRFADRIAVTADESRSYIPASHHHKVVVTGYPVRPELRAWSAETARQTLSLSSDLPTLLVIGGSTGARAINRALLDVLPELLDEMQIVHLSGQLDWPVVEAAREKLLPEQSARYRAYPYLHSEMMGAVFSVADLGLARAGASILGEFPFFGLPVILVPYPHAWRYQAVNAEYLAGRGAAVIVKEPDLPAQLLPTVRRLIHDPADLEKLRSRMRTLAHPRAAQAIADQIEALAALRGGGAP